MLAERGRQRKALPPILLLALTVQFAFSGPAARSSGSPPEPLPGEIVFTCPSDGASICAMKPDATGFGFEIIVKGGGPGEACCAHPVLSPDGTKLAYTGGEGVLTIANADGS